MELQEFIGESLIGIKSGITKANEEFGEQLFRLSAEGEKNFIDFDVAVIIGAKKTKSGEGKITVLGIIAGGGGEKISSDLSVSRIKFRVSSLLIH